MPRHPEEQPDNLIHTVAEDLDYEEEEAEDDSCPHCSGTGISSSGRVDDSCTYCGGSGVERTDDFDDYEY